jgi:hypothetical protein
MPPEAKVAFPGMSGFVGFVYTKEKGKERESMGGMLPSHP